MENHFAFLSNAKAAGLFRLLEKLPAGDAALVLAGLPAALGVQVMAYFPEKRQAELVAAQREARRADPAQAAAAAGRVREMLQRVRNSVGKSPAASFPAASPPPAALGNPPVRPRVPPPSRPAAPPPAALVNQPSPPRAAPPPKPDAGSGSPAFRPPARERGGDSDKPSPGGKLTSWFVRTVRGSPINAPVLPGRPPPVAGDPLQSPLVKSGLMDLIGDAQKKFLPGAGKSKGPPGGGHGVARSVPTAKMPRVIGPGASRRSPAAPGPVGSAPAGARRMDGKAILAAILRRADSGLRENIRREDSALFRELRGRMFSFDDFLGTSEGDLARVFTTAPVAECALALKFAPPALRDRVLGAVSPGRAEAIRTFPHRRAGFDAIELAQKKVLDVALQLQAAGRILIDPLDPDLAG